MHPAPLEILSVPKHCVNSGRGGGGGGGARWVGDDGEYRVRGSEYSGSGC